MTHDEIQATNVENSASVDTPGKILRQAREALSLSQAKVAEKLYLSLQVIKDIEEDDYIHISAPIYVRGYLRNFAQLVHVPEEKILRAFEAMEVTEKFNHRERQFDSDFMLPIYHHNIQPRRKILRWVSLVVLAVLVALVMLWWRSQQHQSYSTVQPDILMKTQLQSQALPKNATVHLQSQATDTKTLDLNLQGTVDHMNKSNQANQTKTKRTTHGIAHAEKKYGQSLAANYTLAPVQNN